MAEGDHLQVNLGVTVARAEKESLGEDPSILHHSAISILNQ
jgi:hypothetical protein